jgi:voltage-gated potassium channel Kch
MKKITLADRLRYQFDNIMSKGPIALIGWLFILSAVIIVLISAAVVAAGLQPAGDSGEPLNFAEIAWMGLLRTLDAGTMGADRGSWPFLLAMLAVTMSGVFVVSMLIGILTSGLEQKISELRKGRSFVVERNHTVILGWSPQVFSILREISVANANRGSGCIVLLAEKDKIEMEDEIRARVGPTGGTRIVCRTGSPLDMENLEIVNLQAARSIIIPSPGTPDSDSRVIKTLLAITNNPGRRAEPYHIVAEMREERNLEAARLVGRDEATLVLAGKQISRIIVQTCRQSGLSLVYNEFLDFGGDEIYFQEEPALVGKTFAESLLAYEDSAVIGLQSRAGVQLNPSMATVIRPGDRLIAVSEDDDTVILSGKKHLEIAEHLIRSEPQAHPRPERTLILGWNKRGAMILSDLDAYVAAGSGVMVVTDTPDTETEIDRIRGECRNLEIRFRNADPSDRRVLEELDLPSFQHVITLACGEMLGEQEADARTLIILLHLRSAADRSGHPFSITSEMLDLRNRQLAEITRADDFVVSDAIISLMLSQLSENRDLMPVFDDLFDPEGSELYLKPANHYVACGEQVNFYTVTASAGRRGEVAVGYRLRREADDPQQMHGIHLNPPKSSRITFSEDDRIIVLAEN